MPTSRWPASSQRTMGRSCSSRGMPPISGNGMTNARDSFSPIRPLTAEWRTSGPSSYSNDTDLAVESVPVRLVRREPAHIRPLGNVRADDGIEPVEQVGLGAHADLDQLGGLGPDVDARWSDWPSAACPVLAGSGDSSAWPFGERPQTPVPLSSNRYNPLKYAQEFVTENSGATSNLLNSSPALYSFDYPRQSLRPVQAVSLLLADHADCSIIANAVFRLRHPRVFTALARTLANELPIRIRRPEMPRSLGRVAA